ncbi:hypothetical protein Hanom_Chr08g00741541 [Helianthus anomalus]
MDNHLQKTIGEIGGILPIAPKSNRRGGGGGGVPSAHIFPLISPFLPRTPHPIA